MPLVEAGEFLRIMFSNDEEEAGAGGSGGGGEPSVACRGAASAIHSGRPGWAV